MRRLVSRQVALSYHIARRVDPAGDAARAAESSEVAHPAVAPDEGIPGGPAGAVVRRCVNERLSGDLAALVLSDRDRIGTAEGAEVRDLASPPAGGVPLRRAR